MKRLRILCLMHEDRVPPAVAEAAEPERMEECQVEFDVSSTLRATGHEVLDLGVRDELAPIRDALEEWKPHVVFNLLEEFRGQGAYDAHVVAYLELHGQPYTGCNPRGLLLGRDKALCKKLLAYHRIRTPRFAVFPLGRAAHRPKSLSYPLIVKSLVEEASLGISQASVVDSDERLTERVAFIHESLKTDALAEQYIDGRELYVGVIGNRRVQVFPPWELLFTKSPPETLRIATRKAKWDKAYQKRHGVDTRAAELTEEQRTKIVNLTKRAYATLGLSGYARIDYRMDANGTLYLLEVNPNPNIAREEDFAESASAAGIPYDKLLTRIIGLGLRGQIPQEA